MGSVGLNKDLVASMVHGESADSADLDILLEMMERGDFDLVAVGRALIADAAWPRKVRDGRVEDLIPYTMSALLEPDSLKTLSD